MTASTRWLPLLVLALSAAASPVGGQQTSSSTPGIWVADASGQLRAVQPQPGFASARQPASAARLRVVLEVESFAQSASGALAANQLAATRVIRATSVLAGATEAFMVSPAVVEVEYARRPTLARSWERPRQAGFRAITQVVMEAPDRQRLGLLLDAAMGAGASQVIAVAPGQNFGWP